MLKKDVFGQFYRFNGVFYEKVNNTDKDAFDVINSDDINPIGLNLANGILTPDYSQDSPTFHLAPHSPSVFYTYVSDFSYKPNFDTIEREKVFEIFTEKDQEIILKTLAASLDINKFKGIKPILFTDIQNETFIEQIWCLQAIVEQAIGCPSFLNFNDFRRYDRNKLFTLIELFGSKAIFPRYSNISLKQLLASNSFDNVIHKESIFIGEKKKKKLRYTPNCVVFCGVNDELPKEENILEQVNKIYSVIEINSAKREFLYPGTDSDDFRDIVSSLLNKILKAFVSLYHDGLYYRNGDFAGKI